MTLLYIIGGQEIQYVVQLSSNGDKKLLKVKKYQGICEQNLRHVTQNFILRWPQYAKYILLEVCRNTRVQDTALKGSHSL